jgi:hypothetical protein
MGARFEVPFSCRVYSQHGSCNFNELEGVTAGRRDTDCNMDGTCTPPHLAPTGALKGQLGISAEEEAEAFRVMEEACFAAALDPSHASYWRDVAWCLAVASVRRKKPGPKERWSKTARLELVTAIERKLRERSGKKKSVELPDITKALRGDPRWPKDRSGSDLTAKALERVYEDTKPEWDRLEAAAQGQGRSLLDDGWLLSL